MHAFFIRWMITTVAVMAASFLIKGIHYNHWQDLLIASLLLGIVNAILKPILMLLSLPILIFTFGLFTMVINSFLLLLVSYFVPGFVVQTWTSAFLGSIVISLVSLFGKGFRFYPKVTVRKGQMNGDHSSKSSPSSGKGKIIDI